MLMSFVGSIDNDGKYWFARGIAISFCWGYQACCMERSAQKNVRALAITVEEFLRELLKNIDIASIDGMMKLLENRAKECFIKPLFIMMLFFVLKEKGNSSFMYLLFHEWYFILLQVNINFCVQWYIF